MLAGIGYGLASLCFNVVVRILRSLVALVLLPPLIGAGWAVKDLLWRSRWAVDFWIAFGGGSAAWLLIFTFLPKPLWLYVTGHELTHALWTLLFGGRVKSIRATSKGGEVVVTRSNVLIVLAPYFFPFYSVLWLVLWGLLHWVFPQLHRISLHFGLGVTYAFHVTLTSHILKIRQTDVTSQGYLLSGAVILLGNLIVLLLALPTLTGTVHLTDALWHWADQTGRVMEWVIPRRWR
jgi:hypothetical protein